MITPYILMHYELLEKINNTKDTDTLIPLCELDVSIAEQFKEEWAVQFPKDIRLPRYPAFQKLAIIYEKAGNYSEAISICKLAIELGFDLDGTKGGMKGRLSRLEKKLQSEMIP